MSKNYADTSGKLSRDSEVNQQTVVAYADAGLLDFIRSSNGTRLFLQGQAPRVREIYERNLQIRKLGKRQPRAAQPKAAA